MVQKSVVGVVLGGVLTLVSPAAASAAVCGAKPYSYAGLAEAGEAHGIRATLTALRPQEVEWGHTAAWVGVDGHDRRGRRGWIQIGFAGFYGGERRIYYEFKKPGGAPTFVEVAGALAFGVPHRVAVRAERTRPSWWRVWLDGKAVSPALRLAGSAHGWRPVAVAESWNAGMGSCNALHFRFRRVVVLGRAWRWRALLRGTVLQDPGYRVRDRTRRGFRVTVE